MILVWNFEYSSITGKEFPNAFSLESGLPNLERARLFVSWPAREEITGGERFIYV
jgi:hypothetical protein